MEDKNLPRGVGEYLTVGLIPDLTASSIKYARSSSFMESTDVLAAATRSNALIATLPSTEFLLPAHSLILSIRVLNSLSPNISCKPK